MSGLDFGHILTTSNIMPCGLFTFNKEIKFDNKFTLTGMVLEVLKLEVVEVPLTLVFEPILQNLVVLQRQLQLQKKVKIYSESMDLLILELLQLFSVKVELIWNWWGSRTLSQIQKKGRFCSPLLELSQRNIHQIMLEKVYYSRP